jgi:hypothetical protein
MAWSLKLSLLVIAAISTAFPQNPGNFPLWGSSWVVAQGDNKNIYASALPLVPEKLAIMDFSSRKGVTVSWANLCKRGYKSTADLLEDIKTQTQKNSKFIACSDIGKGELIDIVYNPFNDTVWSGDDEVSKKIGYYASVGRKTSTDDSLFGPADINKLHSAPRFLREKPIYYGVKNATASDIAVYSLESTDDGDSIIYLENRQYLQQQDQSGGVRDANIGTANLSALSETSPFQSFRKGNYIYEYIPVKYVFRTANIGFWQVHIHPEMWFYPRDPFNGHPLLNDSIKMDFVTACARKKQSIDNPRVIDYQYNRNPFFSDSASVVISFAFVNKPGTAMTTLNSILLVDSSVDVSHHPDKMYRVTGLGIANNWDACKTAVYQLYAQDTGEEARCRNIDSKCGPSLWAQTDRQNGERIFPAVLQKSGIKLVRDRSVDNGIFVYNDCPCQAVSNLKNLTPVQLKRLIYLSPPLCDRADMVKAVELYKKMVQILTVKEDQAFLLKRIGSLQAIIDDRDTKAAAAGIDWSHPNQNCPTTWVKDF